MEVARTTPYAPTLTLGHRMFRRSRLVLPLLAVVFAPGPALTQEKKLTLRWYGQSFFQLETGSGQKIVSGAKSPPPVPLYRMSCCG